MSRPALILTAVLLMTPNVSAASWAEALFDGLSHDFGAVPRGPTQTFAFRVSNKTGERVHIVSARVSCHCVSADVTKKDLAPGEDTTVVVRIDTRRLSGPFQKPVFVQFDQPRFEEVRLNVQANIREDLLVVPDTLAFGQVKKGSAGDANITVMVAGLTDCKIQSAKCDSSYVETKLRRLPGEANGTSYQVTARLRPGLPPGHWYTTVWLETDNPTLRRFQIPVSVEVR